MKGLKLPCRWRKLKSIGLVFLACSIIVAILLVVLYSLSITPFSAALAMVIFSGLLTVFTTLYVYPPTMNILASKVFFEFLLDRPLLFSQLRPLGLDPLDTYLDDYSVKETFCQASDGMNYLRRLDAVKAKSKAEGGVIWTSWQVLDFYVRCLAQTQERFPFHKYIINQMEGFQSEVQEKLVNHHQIKDWRGAYSFVRRCQGLPAAVEQIVEQLQERQKRGITTPAFVLDRCMQNMREAITPSPSDHVLVKTFWEKVQVLPSNDSKAKALGAELLAAVRDEVYPAWAKLELTCKQLKEQWYGTGSSLSEDEANHGLGGLPDGDEYYRACLREHTTTELTPDEVHSMGLTALSELHQSVKEVLMSMKLKAGTPQEVKASIKELQQAPEHLYTHLDESQAKKQIIQDYKAIVAEALTGTADLFNVVPERDCSVEAMPAYKEAGSPGAMYYPPALDGSKNGVFYANLRNVSSVVKWEMRTLAFHEAVPGHHFQLSIAQQMPLPFFRAVIPFAAYQEGWALYTEMLCDEVGLQKTPADRLGYLSGQLMRAARLVVDTGIHAKRWSREKAVNFMMENTLLAEKEAITEVERYFVIPGQACSYWVGLQSILACRRRAKASLGEQFDLRSFHDVVLGCGAVPLSVLDELVDDWVRRASAP
ncbi:unnamed protein product [Chrysoparadoxa australica]